MLDKACFEVFHTDNWLDIAGYIMLVGNRLQIEEEFNERTK